MGVVGYTAHKKADEGKGWDGAGARKRLLAWAGGPDKAKVDWGKYSQGFAWFGGENKENAGAYKLPHSDVIDGAIVDVWAGVSAAMGALLGARGGTDIPSGDRKGCYNHLRRHYAQWEKEAPEFREYAEGELRALFPEMYNHEIHENHEMGEMDELGGVSQVRAELVTVGPRTVERALEIINQRFAQRKLTADEIHVLPPAELSNQNLDSYFTRMAQSTLENYLEDALTGVPLMNSHRRFLPAPELPLGQSYNARLDQDGDNTHLVVDFYMLRNLQLNGMNTDDVMRAVDGGTIRDLSVGFSGGWYKCGLCGRELAPMSLLFSGAKGDFCEHVPGVGYDGQTAYAWVEDARLVEGSLVYAGATPGAVLRKAQWAASTGRLAAGDVSVLEDRWGIRIQDPGYKIQAVDLSGRNGRSGQDGQTAEAEEVSELGRDEVMALVGEKAPELAERVQAAEEPVGALVEAWVEARTSRESQDKMATALADELQQRLAETEKKLAEQDGLRAAAESKIMALEPRAADGDAYRADLIQQAVEARVRAQGSAFDAKEYQNVLEDQTLDYIRGEIESWDKTARQVFQPGRVVGKIIGREQDAGKQEGRAPGKPRGAYKA